MILRRSFLCGWLVAAVCGGLLANARAQSASNGFWQAQSIYQIFTDRFYDGDPANNNASGSFNAANGGSVHGGDFKGILQKLDYVKSLGATAIWISPVVQNTSGQYHGYHGRDFYKVDAHWGTLADLTNLVSAAHARGLLVIDDIICNHGGDLINSADAGYGNFVSPPAGYTLKYRNAAKQYPPPFDLNATNSTLEMLFHNNGLIQNFSDSTQVELGELSNLDDFKTESEYVRARMAEIYQYWIGTVGFDGFRVDTVKHCEMGFWQSWCPAIHDYAAASGKSNFFMFGEILDSSESKCGSYTGTKGGGAFKLDSVLDYPLFYAINSVFAAAAGNTAQLENHYAAVAANYDPAAQNRLVTFLDNHDQPRFLNSANASNSAARLSLALAFLYTARGIPCLYYGTEQAFSGATDPADREDMFDGQYEQGPSLGDNFNMTHPQFQWVAKLNNFRRLYPALQTGAQVGLASNSSGPGLFAYARRLGTQEVFVVLNTASSTKTLSASSTINPVGTTLVNLLNPDETIVVGAGPQTPSVSVPATSAKLFVAQSQWLLLDPVVITNSPAHDATNVSTFAPIVLLFSKPMNTNSVQAAFSTVPTVSGAFSWSAALDTMTFTPGNVGFPGLTNITVRLASSAVDGVSSNAFVAAYELKFKTGVPTCKITNVEIVAGSLRVSCTTATNHTYQLQRRENLGVATMWTNIGAAATGTGGVVMLNDGSTDTNATRYYRVQVL